MRVVLSIDPAKAAGAALFIDGKLTGNIEFAGDSFWTSYDAVEWLLHNSPNISDEATRVCIIEEQVIPGRGGKGALTLGRRRGLVQAAAEAHGFNELVLIGASTWQNKLFGGRVETGETKNASIARVQTAHGITTGPDVADAINIGDYYLQFGLTLAPYSVKKEAHAKFRPKKLVRPLLPVKPTCDTISAIGRKRSRKSLRTAGITGAERKPTRRRNG